MGVWNDSAESRGFRKDTHGPGYWVTDVRMIGAHNRECRNITLGNCKRLLEDLVWGDGPCGSCCSKDLFGEWFNDPDLVNSETSDI